MEILFHCEPGPTICDLLDKLIALGAPVTPHCYQGVLSARGAMETLCYDMILAVLKSGALPESFDNGNEKKLPLDYIIGTMRDLIEEDAMMEFFLPDFM